MVKKDSLYSINKKNPDAVVYKFVNGEEHRITREDFPTEEAFLAFKAWSDKDFHEEEKLDHREANHTLSTEDLSEAALATPAVDVVMERQQQRAEHRRMISDMVIKLKDKLTEKQFRRMWMKFSEGKTEEEIAEIEGTTQQAISLSIVSALEKIEKKKKFF